MPRKFHAEPLPNLDTLSTHEILIDPRTGEPLDPDVLDGHEVIDFEAVTRLLEAEDYKLAPWEVRPQSPHRLIPVD